jgi:outer membrane protein assembly factor BamB
VLTRDDAAFFSAGRSSFLDGGIRVYAVEPLTGKLLWQSVATNTGINDLMVDDGETVHVRFEGFDARDGTPRTRGEGPGPLVSATGMLDPAWPPRVSWRRPGAEGAWGELLAFRGPTTCGVLSFSDYGYVATKHFSTMPDVGMSPCRIFARGGGVSWETRVNVRPQALVLAGDKLVVAGTPVALDEQDPWGAFEGRRGGELLVLSAADGRETDRLKLDSPPVYDGLAVADGRLFMACRDGTLRCFGEP